MILDLVGASHFQGNIDCLTIEGRLLLVGMPGGSEAKINLGQVRISLRKRLGPNRRPLPEDRLLTQNGLKDVLGSGAGLCASSTFCKYCAGLVGIHQFPARAALPGANCMRHHVSAGVEWEQIVASLWPSFRVVMALPAAFRRFYRKGLRSLVAHCERDQRRRSVRLCSSSGTLQSRTSKAVLSTQSLIRHTSFPR